MKQFSKQGRTLLESVLVFFIETKDFETTMQAIETIAVKELASGPMFQDVPGARYLKKARPHEISYQDHLIKVNQIFSNSSELMRVQMIERTQAAYGVGKTKVEQAGGFLNYLLAKGFVEKTYRGFKPGNPDRGHRATFNKQLSEAYPEAPKDL